MEIQSPAAASLKATAELETGELTMSYSTAFVPGGVMILNPGSAVGKEDMFPCKTAAHMISLEFVVETLTDVLLPNPLAVPGKELFGSNGDAVLDPLMPKTMMLL